MDRTRMLSRRAAGRRLIAGLMAAAGGRCALCEEEMIPAGALVERSALDHVLQLALGGPDHPSNLRPVHWWCNAARSVLELHGIGRPEVYRKARLRAATWERPGSRGSLPAP
jgi:hypothetical protein